MIKIGLAGGRGYVGEELLGLLDGNPDFEVVYVGSRSSAGKPVTGDYKNLNCDLVFQDLSAESLRACAADVWVIAQPNGQAASFVEILDDAGSRLIDISSDFRFDDRWTYGLPERNADSIGNASRVANPGCYATAMQLALLPLIDQLDGTPHAFGVSGFSGAGRTPGDKNNPARLEDNLLPYSLAGHMHEREVSYQLKRDVRFTPHVASFFRGISITVHLRLQQPTTRDEISRLYSEYYGPHALVNTTGEIPEIRQVANTNLACVGGFAVDSRDPRWVSVVSVIDNLRKGAASQALQNLNLMFGMESEKGLIA